jgi:hypothetical protein
MPKSPCPFASTALYDRLAWPRCAGAGPDCRFSGKADILKSSSSFWGSIMPRRRLVTATLGSVLLLGACADGLSRVMADTPSTAYSPLEFSAAAGGRDLRTDIHGNPFPIEQTAFNHAVTQLMQNKHFGPSTHFTTTPNETANPNYRVVMVFNSSGTVLNTNLCSAAPIPTRPATGEPIRVQAAFCRGGTLTSATGWAPAVASPEAPTFQRLIADTTFSLFPFRDPNQDDDQGCWMPEC